jgi:hypothetical protein
MSFLPSKNTDLRIETAMDRLSTDSELGERRKPVFLYGCIKILIISPSIRDTASKNLHQALSIRPWCPEPLLMPLLMPHPTGKPPEASQITSPPTPAVSEAFVREE